LFVSDKQEGVRLQLSEKEEFFETLRQRTQEMPMQLA
jgi:hypothetical protein